MTAKSTMTEEEIEQFAKTVDDIASKHGSALVEGATGRGYQAVNNWRNGRVVPGKKTRKKVELLKQLLELYH